MNPPLGASYFRLHLLRCFGIATILLFVSSCSILPATENLEIYLLPAAESASHSSGDSLPWTLRLATPYSSYITDSPRVLALRQGNQLSSYKGIRWSDPAPVLLRNRLVAAFRTDGRFNSVSNGNSSNNLATDLELGGDLSAFQVEYTNDGPQATIRFYATLSQPLRNRIVAARSFEISEPVQSRGTSEIITAFGLSADRLAAEIIDWTVQQGMVLQTEAKK
ncbi:cholesterol transport system auxiliary component [Nitrosospira multiformis]|uniref:Cholesterol transport system auxiliary component n=1 Tax=Nitrosospira multiformis TaxID=1231 RepID=A0A2T5I757_9PROT|nr:ABC-type transport auxiliary lipoprotein family protein [Nitrosospira multiformis]PTQ79639.1 cholesterol transport system auxiliary component [Nitrosospira multiformis]